jgi:hypothetical protein
METNNIITQILSFKKSLTGNSLTVIERDLIKKQLLECYELLVNDAVIPKNNPVIEKTSPPEPVQTGNRESRYRKGRNQSFCCRY